MLKDLQEPRYGIDWAFDLGDDWWPTGEEEHEPWGIFTKESASPSKADILYSSPGVLSAILPRSCA